MSETDQSSFKDWAILEIFGHARYAGYVQTQVFGTETMFRIDVPPLEERTRVTMRAGSVDGHWTPAGSTVKESATPGYSKLFGAKAIYCLTPCTQEAALAAVEEIQPRSLMLVALPTEKALEAPAESTCPKCGAPSSNCTCILSEGDESYPEELGDIL